MKQSYKKFIEDMEAADHVVCRANGVPFVHVVDPEFVATQTDVKTAHFEESSEPGLFCLYPDE